MIQAVSRLWLRSPAVTPTILQKSLKNTKHWLCIACSVLATKGSIRREYRALFDKIRESMPLIAMPHGESPGIEHVPDEFVKHSIMVGTEAECVQRLKEILALKPDEVSFTVGDGKVADVEKVANLVAKATAQ